MTSTEPIEPTDSTASATPAKPAKKATAATPAATPAEQATPATPAKSATPAPPAEPAKPATPATASDPFVGIPSPISAALVGRGFTELTAVQRAVLDSEFKGRDLRISSQTGSGKTIAIGLALATELEAATNNARPQAGGKKQGAEPVALVIVPTRELAAQVREELEWLYANLKGVRVDVVTGGTSLVMERRALSRKPTVVVGTPGRLLDHMRNNALNCQRIAHVVLDEADQMLDMGFREELEGILDQLPKKRASHLVSATFPQAVLRLANQYQNEPLAVEGTALGVANQDIHHIAYSIRRHETYGALVNVLLLAEDSRCLVFVNRRVDATEMAEKLAADGFGAAPFSGDLPQAQRTRTLNAFKNGTFNILVSTDVAARGIDVPEISTVVHIDPPRTPDAYIHRSGRTGRAGLAGRSILLVAGPETRRVTRLLRTARIEVSWQPVPQPEKVAKALLKQGRRKMHAQLAEAAPTESELLYAKQLLEEKDPAHLVATLLEMAMPKPKHAPMKVQGLDPFEASKKGAQQGRKGVPAGADRPFVESYTQFRVSWGEKSGATTSRLLSHICRRGGISSGQVGAIRIEAKSATVDVASDVASLFESKTRRPDKRDPGITISRSEGRAGAPAASAPSGQRPPTGPAKATSGKPPSKGFKGRPPKSGRPSRPEHLKGKGPRRTASR